MAKRPQTAHDLFRKGTRALQQGETADAVKFLEKARKKDPDHKDITLNLSSAYILSKKFKQAIPLLEKLLEELSDVPSLWLNLGAAYLGNPILAKDEDQKKAISAFAKAYEINPRTPNAAYNLGLVHRDRQEYSKAKAWFVRAVEANPEDEDAEEYIAKMDAKLAE